MTHLKTAIYITSLKRVISEGVGYDGVCKIFKWIYLIFDKLVPKDHLLIKVDETVDFSFVSEHTKSLYSDVGRPSYDPETIFKMQLLEFIYNISDVEVCKTSQTDIAFRWFLRLGLDDAVPDDTTISDCRCNGLTPDIYDGFFNEIVKQCIDANFACNIIRIVNIIGSQQYCAAIILN